MNAIGRCALRSMKRCSRMREAYEITAWAARLHGKWMGVGGVREDQPMHRIDERCGAGVLRLRTVNQPQTQYICRER